MNREAVKAALVFMLVGLVLGGIIGYGVFGRGKATDYVSERDTVTVVDTVWYYQPMVKDSSVVRYVTRYLSAAKPALTEKELILKEKVSGSELPTQRQINEVRDTFFCDFYAQNNGENIPPLYASVDSDSAAVAIPITQKRYENEDYRAYVSGYEPNLDSIFVFPKTTVIHERSYKPPNKWHIGITGGYGYGFKSKQAEPYIGIGITYSIISFDF